VWGVNRATSDELDDGLQLDTRAASSLLAGRPFATVAQMGAAPYVGATVLTRLRDHAPVWHALRAGAPTLAGTYDGVQFDEATAKAALTLCNRATLQELLDGGLPIAGAAPIIGNRPYTTLTQVSNVSGVGAATMAALQKLAAAAVPVTPSVPVNGSCDNAQLLCLSGLVCSGLSYGPTGHCRPAWMANTFRSGTQLGIPDRNAFGASMGVTVSGLGSAPEDITVHLNELDHPALTELRIILTAPNGAAATVWEAGAQGAIKVPLPASFDRSGPVNGVWVLTVIDTAAGNSGTLNGWTLELTSR
jgi:DNA uptake protein ComE-like DNA-binding protein